MNNEILVGISENNIFIKPIGSITANNCFTIREFFFNEIPNFYSNFNLFVDLSETRYMDSTFLGILVGLEKKLIKLLKKHLIVINPNDHSMSTLRNMGLDFFLKIKHMLIPEKIAFSKFDNNSQLSDIEKLRTMFFSHSELSSINKNNRQKFKKVKTAIKKEIKKKKKEVK